MPRGRLKPRDIPNREALVSALVREWRQPSDDPAAPVIIEAAAGSALWSTARLYVVWDAWDDLDLEDRHSIIDSALAELHREPGDSDELVFGLTSDEAEAMGISYEVIE